MSDAGRQAALDELAERLRSYTPAQIRQIAERIVRENGGTAMLASCKNCHHEAHPGKTCPHYSTVSAVTDPVCSCRAYEPKT